MPIDATDGTSQCVASASTVDAGFQTGFRVLTSNHGRVYNLHMRDGTTSGTIGYLQYSIASTVPPTTLDFVGGFHRIHEVETILGNAAPGCQLADSTDEIGCIVSSDPCSVGYGGNSGTSWALRTNGFSGTNTDPAGTWSVDGLNVAGVAPLLANVQKLGTPGEYQLSRKIYLNSLRGFDTIAATTGDPAALGATAGCSSRP